MEQKICINCGTIIVAEGRTKFCSTECQAKYYGKEIATTKVVVKESSLTIKQTPLKKKKSSSKIKQSSLPLLKKVCKHCGKEFMSRKPKAIFCSDNCYGKNYYKTYKEKLGIVSKPTKRICKLCGKEFEAKNSKRVFCSINCVSKYHSKRYKNMSLKEKEEYVNNIKQGLNTLKRFCKSCGKEFEPTSGRQIFCNIKCAQKGSLNKGSLNKYKKKQKEHLTELPKLKKVCKHCGKEFVTPKSNKVFCSDCCRVKYFYNKNKLLTEPTKKSCKYCGKEFESTNPKRLYCSDDCKLKNSKIMRGLNVSSKTRNCKICGKEFQPNVKYKVYCSKECYNIDNKIVKVVLKMVCPVCGKKFKTYNKQRIFCSAKCGKKDSRIKNKIQLPPLVKNCKYCGKEFETTRKDKIYCSYKCVRHNEREIAKERRHLKLNQANNNEII